MVLQIEIKLTGKCDKCLKCEKLLQRATGAINCENYHKVRYSRGIHKVLLGKNNDINFVLLHMCNQLIELF